jgi:hypothetical protein
LNKSLLLFLNILPILPVEISDITRRTFRC